MAEFNYVCVDVETTGLNHQSDEVVEVTAIEFNLSGETGEAITQLCRPLIGYIPPVITKINGITWDMVKDKPNYIQDRIRENVAKFFGIKTIVGHNIIDFDIKFLKIRPKRMEDTLKMCRARYSGGNKLKTACQRLGIEWKDEDAHRSEYDTRKCIELFVKIKELERKEQKLHEDAPLFASAIEERDRGINKIMSSVPHLGGDGVISTKIKTGVQRFGVIPTEGDKKLLATQAYSFSRINLFHQCKFKWYMIYIRKIKEIERDYLITGKITHKIAEWSGEWCYRELFANKLASWARTNKLSITDNTTNDISKDLGVPIADVTFHDFGYYLYKHPGKIKDHFEYRGLADIIYNIDKAIQSDSYEVPSMPDRESYNEIVEKAITLQGCVDPDIIKDIKYIMNRFYETKDFSLLPSEIILTEKRLAFDKDWNLLQDFYSNLAFIRGIIDVISYFGNCVIITDYKSSRKMATIEQLKEDMQMKTYVLLIYNFLPKDSYNKITVRVEYIRFGKIVEYDIDDVKAVADSALSWINNSIQQVEKEMMKSDGLAFEPTRNEYCHACFLGEDGKCPLFSKAIHNNIEDPFSFIVKDVEDCQSAWKRVEANKAENTRLAKLCKTFVQGCADKIPIDEHATLDFYTEESRSYFPIATMKILLEKKLDMKDIIKFFRINASSMDELLARHNIKLTNEELDKISKKKVVTKFDAFTQKEAKSKGYINA